MASEPLINTCRQAIDPRTGDILNFKHLQHFDAKGNLAHGFIDQFDRTYRTVDPLQLRASRLPFKVTLISDNTKEFEAFSVV